MAYQADPRVDAYIDALPRWQQEICRTVRDLVHEVDPEVTETVKRTVQPYFTLEGNICALLAAKDHVNVFLYDGGLVPDPDGIIRFDVDPTVTYRLNAFYVNSGWPCPDYVGPNGDTFHFSDITDHLGADLVTTTTTFVIDEPDASDCAPPPATTFTK